MNSYLLQENGSKILLDGEDGALIIAREASIGGGTRRKRRSPIEGGDNSTPIDDTAQRRKLAQRNAVIMVTLH